MIALTQSRRRRTWPIVLGAIVILVPSLLGFGNKFLELVAVYRGESDGAFAVAPIVNYLLASLGFLMLFGWAAAHGMFRDIERPKWAMLENEASLDRAAARSFHRGHQPGDWA